MKFLPLILALGFISPCAEAIAATPPIMVDASNRWKIKYSDTAITVLCAAHEGRHWTDVSPQILATVAKRSEPTSYSDIAALSPLDENRAWMAIILPGQTPAPDGHAYQWPEIQAHDYQLLIEYTSDGGRHWREKTGPEPRSAIFLSFLDDKEGFLLTMSGSLGNHRESIYHTTDGGKNWQEMPSPTRDGTSYYANGIVFRMPLEGWITATYHGNPDVPLFHTTDGAKTWQVQPLEIPPAARGGYGNVFPPFFTDKNKRHGYLPVKLVHHQPPSEYSALINYETGDGGATWRLPQPILGK